MMRNTVTITSILLIALVCFSSCKASKQAAAERKAAAAQKQEDEMYKNMGVDMCDCMSPIFKVTKELKNVDAEDTAAALSAVSKMQKIAPKVEDCINGLKTKYPKIDFEASSNQKAEKALYDNCPEMKEMEEEMDKKQREYNKAKELKEKEDR